MRHHKLLLMISHVTHITILEGKKLCLSRPAMEYEPHILLFLLMYAKNSTWFIIGVQ